MALGMSVKRAQAEIDAAEFAEWVAFASLEPFGVEVLYHIGGIIASTIANAHRGKGSRSFKPADFMPKFQHGPRKGKSVEGLKAMLMMIAGAQNKAVEKGKR